MERKCGKVNAIYKFTIKTSNLLKNFYLGVAQGEWKILFYNHKKYFKNCG